MTQVKSSSYTLVQVWSDFEKRVLKRAYFLCINGVSEDEVYNYFEALRIELGQRPYEI